MISIWCFWAQGKEKIPPFHKKCLINWENMLSNKDFKINVIDLNSFLKMQNEIDENFMNKLTYQQQSDIVRLCLLYEYGGIWIDITTILTQDLSWVIDKFDKGYEQVGFYVNYKPWCKKTKNILESWFIAVKNKNNYMISQWKKTFIIIMTESIKNNGIKNSKTWKETNKSAMLFGREYLSIHVAHLWCIQNDVKYRNIYENDVYLYHANITALLIPLTIKNIILTPILGYAHSINFPLIKFTSWDMKIMNKLGQNFISNKIKDIFNKYLGVDYKIINKKI